MIKFRTEVELPGFREKMGYRNHSLMIGSCFAENIGIWLRDRSLPVMVNPFGILYNPVSIANSLALLISGKKFTIQDLFYANGVYNSFSHHSRFSESDPEKMLERINLQADQALHTLENCSHLFITFGTAWVFQHKVSGDVVSNCHKLPAATFNRYRLSVAQITERWIPLIEQIRQINPNLHPVFTVSPIRHLKDGAHENQLSKSTLILAIDALTAHFGDERISYFPSYELLLDELRDYRFYAADMTHLSETATDFIREKFAATILDQEAINVINEVDKIVTALSHRPNNSDTGEYIAFIGKQLVKLDQLQIKYPFADFGRMKKKFNKKRSD